MFEYSEILMEHFYAPHNIGTLDANSPNVGTGMIGSPACGDVMRLQIKVGDNDVITDAKFKAYGCGSAIAASSVATDWLKGKTLDEALKIKNSGLAEYLTLPALKIHCSVLAEEVIKAALDDYHQKQSARDGSSNEN